MKAFELYDAKTVDEAVALLTQHGPSAKIVAGGSDQVTGIMKDWVTGKGLPYPKALIDVTTIPELHGIKVEGGAATIGAATTLTEMVENQQLSQGWPVLTQSAFSVASPLIRNYGTLGGNINQIGRASCRERV